MLSDELAQMIDTIGSTVMEPDAALARVPFRFDSIRPTRRSRVGAWTSGHLRAIGITVLALAIGGVAAVFATRGAAPAAPPAHWSPPAVLGVPSGTASIACSSPAMCVAIGFSTPGGSAVAAEASGVWRQARSAAPLTSVTSVACSPDDACIVAGTRAGSGAASVADRDGTWSAAVSIGGMESVTSISCASSTACVAVGSGGASAGSGSAPGASVAAEYNGATWSSPVPIDVAASSVSCPAPSFCAAVGGDTATTFDGSLWSTPVVFPGSELDAVSCTSHDNCVAVGGHSGGESVTLGATGWSSVAQVPATSALTSVTCSAAISCLATESGSGAMVTYAQGVWAPLPAVPSGFVANDVTCAGTLTGCTAVGVATGAASVAVTSLG